MGLLYKRKKTKSNKGMTLVEMVVSFALLSIIVAASTVIISNVTVLYYRVRGENYARQISNIVITKITSEVSGAKFSTKNVAANPRILKKIDGVTLDGNAIELYDRTNTRVRIYSENGHLKVHYPSITVEDDDTKNRTDTDWNYDEKIYNGFTIDELYFVQADAYENTDLATRYGITGFDMTQYPDNVIAVYMTLSSPKYGKFQVYRYVRVYEAPETDFEIDIIE